MRPRPTPTASFKKYGTVAHPLIGDVCVGVGEGVSDRDDAIAAGVQLAQLRPGDEAQTAMRAVKPRPRRKACF